MVTRGRGVGLRQVADRAAVSIGTVSHYLNHPELVSPETRERIAAAIDELGFVPHIAGRHLRQGVSDVVGFVATDLSNPNFVDLAAEVETAGADRGLRVFLANSRGDRSREDEYLALFESFRVRGVVVASHLAIEDRLQAMNRRGTPTVLVGQRADSPEQMWVSADNVEGGRLIGEHLVQSGRTRVAFVGGPAGVPQIDDRIRGVGAALAGRVHFEVVPTPERTIAAGVSAADRLLTGDSLRPDAIVAGNDLLALGVLQAATRLGVRVPEDLAITGYDDTAFSRASLIPITSVGQDHDRTARVVLEMLMSVVDGELPATRQCLIAPQLLVRESSASPVGRRATP